MVEYEVGESLATVIIGIDGQPPPLDVLRDVESLVGDAVNDAAGFDYTRDSVTLTMVENPTKDQKSVLGSKTLYIMKFDISLGRKDLNMGIVSGAHNTAVKEVNELQFNITGTATVWDGKMQR